MKKIETSVIDEDLRSVAQPAWYRRYFRTTAGWVLVLDVVLMLLFGLLSNGLMWTDLAIQSMLYAGTEALLLGLALTVLLGAGIFDLSLAANLVLASVVAGLTVQGIIGGTGDKSASGLAFAFVCGFIAALLSGVLYGLINGLVIAYLRVNSLIATLGTMGIGTGLVLVITNGSDIAGLPEEIKSWFGQVILWNLVPLAALVAVVAAVVLWFFIRYTRFGVLSLAIGSSLSAAERAGIRVRLRYLLLTGVAGSLAGLAGFIDIARYGASAMVSHNQDALAAVTAVVIGGTLLEGGKVSIIGTIWGTLLSVILLTGLIVIGVPSFYQIIGIGVVLIIAVSLDSFRSRRGLR